MLNSNESEILSGSGISGKGVRMYKGVGLALLTLSTVS